jgi:hypothetical protein
MTSLNTVQPVSKQAKWETVDRGNDMTPEEIDIIKNEICPKIHAGQASLLLGAGFSYKNPSLNSELPTGDGLRDALLEACGKSGRVSLKDAYAYAERHLPNFREFIINCFTVTRAHFWQQKIFQYVWNRIYTTNIDNVLRVAHDTTAQKGKLAAAFSFINYTDIGIIGQAIGTVPVVAMHGQVENFDQGFIFSNQEYGRASGRKVLDWHNELSARMLVGGLVVIGSQLDESDFDTYLAARQADYGDSVISEQNWIIMPSPDEIKKDNYIAAGYKVIDCTAEEFFNVVYATVPPRTIADIIAETVPTAHKRNLNHKAMVWFKEAFNPVNAEIEKARKSGGILRHFISGYHPNWLYIVNQAHADTPKIRALTAKISASMSAESEGYGILHVTGPSGSGKTTALRAALLNLVEVYPYIYEYDSENGVDIEFLYQIIHGFTQKAIIVFYSAAALYYTVNALAERLNEEKRSYVLFLLEERTHTYRKNRHHLSECSDFAEEFPLGKVTFEEAKAIAEKIKWHGLEYEDFSEYPIDKQARIILDSERGYHGDLLATLFSLTYHQNFEDKIYKEYHEIENLEAQKLLDHTAIINSFGFGTPIGYLSGFMHCDQKQILSYLNTDLRDLVITLLPSHHIVCRHRVIADFYFKNCISKKGDVDTIVNMLDYLSRQFTISDIRLHPLAYEIYKNLISFNFLYEQYFPAATRRNDTERTYHAAQKFFTKDGVFWLQFGRFYRKIGELDNAIDCYRAGLSYYDSFQTRHALGTVLLEKYIEQGCAEKELYDEGLKWLENERIRRGALDPYPTTTLCNLIFKIHKQQPENKEIYGQLTWYMNYGVKNFKEDDAFNSFLQRFYRKNP